MPGRPGSGPHRRRSGRCHGMSPPPVPPVSTPPTSSRCLVPLLALAAAGCLMAGPAGLPRLAMVEHGLRLEMEIPADGWVDLEPGPSRAGRLDVNPILAAEDSAPPAILQGLRHYGRYYFLAEGFRHVWEVTPRPGTATATYRPVAVADDGLPAGARLSAYGPQGRACVRLDRPDLDPLFIPPGGQARDHCG